MAEGKLQEALDHGDKALAAFPNGIEIMLLQVDIAQQLKNYPKVVDYAARASGVMNTIATQPKPAGMSDQDFAAYLNDAQAPLRTNLEYMETAAYNSIASEDNARKRIQEVEKFIPAFPNSKFMERVTTVAIVSLGELKDTAGLAAFGDKVLAKSPDDMRLLIVLANAYADDPSGTYLDKARTFAKHAIDVSAKQGASADPKLVGLAHSVLGYVMLRQNQFPAAATELKTATAMLKDSPMDEAAALYRLGFAYAKMEKAADATKALSDCAAIDGPYQPLARDLLDKIKAARSKAH